ESDRSAIPTTPRREVFPFQKKYGQLLSAPRGLGTASRACFIVSGIGRKTASPLFCVRRNIRQVDRSASHEIESFLSWATSTTRSAVCLNVNTMPRDLKRSYMAHFSP